MLNDTQIIMVNFVKNNPNCRVMDIVKGTNLKKSVVYKFIKSGCFDRSEKIKGGNAGKGGGFYYTYTVKEAPAQSFVNQINGYIDRHPVKPKIPKIDELTKAFFGLPT